MGECDVQRKERIMLVLFRGTAAAVLGCRGDSRLPSRDDLGETQQDEPRVSHI
jgi:hypothetical protein